MQFASSQFVISSLLLSCMHAFSSHTGGEETRVLGDRMRLKKTVLLGDWGR